MDEHEQALTEAISDIEYLEVEQFSPSEEYTKTYRRAIYHAANSIREILTKYQDMK